MRKKIISHSFFFALGETIYIFFVALVMKNANQLFGNNPGVLPIITFLLLFVLSAAISGALILGKPTLLYLEGRKKEALDFFGFTLGWMLVFMAVMMVIVSLIKN